MHGKICVLIPYSAHVPRLFGLFVDMVHVYNGNIIDTLAVYMYGNTNSASA